MKAWKCDICGRYSTDFETDKELVTITDSSIETTIKFDVCRECAEKIMKIFDDAAGDIKNA